MPSLIREQPVSSSSDDGFQSSNAGETQVVSDHEYPALSFPGYAEKPLAEQLEPIAIVGMGCRLPGNITSPAEFWDMMLNKRTGQTPKVPSSRFNIDAHYHSNNERPGSFNVLGGYFLNSDLQEFDPALFGISPIEAMWLDPQQRKLLEVVYEALESGGVTMDAIAGTKTACFVGSFTSDYQQMSFKEPDFRHSYAATGVDPGIISNRISHVFNLKGPSITVNTACSSSVYAMHNACNALRNRECCGAIVGGTNLVLTVDQHMNTAKLGVLSPTSTCRTFDVSADGYGRADGVGAVYLKRLSDAVRDGDVIRALIRSSAVNSNGKAPAVGITHPNLEGQVDVIKHAYSRGGDLDPRLTGYFECHGTGTPIGDPLEVHAVAKAMNYDRESQSEPLWIGAVKPNVGHSEAASGLSAVIKAALAVEKGVIPPTRGVSTPNPKIKWNEWNLKVVTEPVPFPDLPVRRVSVNSFGYGGTNGHVIIENVGSFLPSYESGPTPNKSKARGSHNRKRPFLLPLSAHDKPTLKRNIAALAKSAQDYSLLDLSYTLANRRSRLSSRAFVVASHVSLDTALGNDAEAFKFAEKKKRPTVGFAFTGQGAQWARMGSELMAYYPSFMRSIKVLDRALGELIDGPDWTLEDSLLEDAETSRVNEAEFSQPLCTAIQVAIVQLLLLWGVQPVVTVGHSSGEIAAAYAAGLISPTEAIVVAYYRGKVVRNVNTNGAMMAVGLGAEDVSPFLEGLSGEMTIACHNSPSSVTLSGDAPMLEKVKSELDARGIFARSVKTGGKAYHSHHMGPVAAEYEKLIKQARAYASFDLPSLSNATMVSSVTNSKISDGTVMDEQYWSANLRSPVLFNQAIQTIATDSEFADVDMLIEIGPHSALSGPIHQICGAFGFDKLSYLPTILRGANSASQLLKVAGELFLRDYPLDMDRVTVIEEALPKGQIHLVKGSVLVDLPTYQWNYAKTLWAEPRQSIEHRAPKHARHDVLGGRMPGGSKVEPMWRNMLRIRDIPWLQHHSLGGEAVFPAAGYFSMAIEAITQVNEDSSNPLTIESYVLRDVSIKAALVTPDDDTGIETIFSMRPSVYSEADTRSTWWDFNVSSTSKDGHWNNHMTGTISINTRQRGQSPKQVPNLPQRASGKSWNEALREVGFDYGATFQDMTDIRSDGKTFAAAAKTIVKQECGIVEGESRYALHPGTVDSCLQLIIVSIYAGRLNEMTCGAVPIQVDEVAIWPPTAEQLQIQTANAYSWTDQRGIRSFVSGSQLVTDDGELLMDITDMRCTAYEAAVPQKVEGAIKVEPYGEMVWKYDIDSLTRSSKIGRIDVSQLVELAVHKNPTIKVLEIGSKHAAAILAKAGHIQYMGTVLSDEELEQISMTFGAYKNATFQRVDPAQTLDSQDNSIPEGIFDLIVVPNDLASPRSLQNMQRFLALGGRAIFELSEISGGTLQAVGFAGSDALVFNQQYNGPLLVLSSVLEPSVNGSAQVNGVEHEALIVYRKSPASIVHEIEKALQTLGWSSETISLEEYHDRTGEHVIMLADLEGRLLATLEEKELTALRDLTTTASSILWVTGGGLMAGKIPEFGMAAGLARSITSEQASLDLTTLDFDIETTSNSDMVDIIITSLHRQCSKVKTRESEYCVSNGLVFISRLVPNDDLNRAYAFDKQQTESIHFDSDARLVGKVQSGKIVFEADESTGRPLETNQVEVKVALCGLNKEDTLVINGTDYPTAFSHEIGGTVSQVGNDVTNFRVGDRVAGFSFDKLATFQRTPAELVQKLESGDKLEEFVTLPMAYGAALYGLKTLANIEADENVLILNGTGSAGVAAVKISQLMSAKPYVVVGKDAEAEILMKSFGLSPEQVLMPSQLSVTSRLDKLTAGHGADVVFSSGFVEPSLARECWRRIAPFGRFVDSSRKNVLKRSVLDTLPLNQGANYLSFDLLDLYHWKPQTMASLLRLTSSLYHQRLISPISPININSIAEVDSAVASFSDDFTAGKTLISYESSDQIIKVLPSHRSLQFKPDVTYLLVGCLGGLGRSLTSWMMEHGARRFAFLSRSGTDSKQAAILVDEIEAAGVAVQVIRGDATILADVQRAVEGIPAQYPIRGVVQAAMVLQDGLFHSMSYSSWITSTRPKVQGTLNLHQALQHIPLDFFVMTSSTSGTLGTPGQSNYAAANSFLDSLARHRTSRGLPAVSLILPMVLGVGYVAEHPEIEEALKRKGIYGIDETHLLESFEAAIATQGSASSIDHVVVGLDPAKLQKSLNESATTDSFWMEDQRFNHLIHAMKSAISNAGGGGAGQTILATIRSAASPAEAIQSVSDYFVDKLSRLLLVDLDEFEPDVKAIADYGLDSMIGAELRNWIFKELALDIPFQQLLGPSLTITKFATEVCANQGVVLAGDEA